MTQEELKKYIDFMNTPGNAYNCSVCPENRGDHSKIERRLPCGQQNCWVVCHTWKGAEG